MRIRPGQFIAAVCVCVAAVLTGCGQSHTPVAQVSSLPQANPGNPRAQLAARAAAAKDRRYVAGYALARSSHRSQAVLVTIAGDGTWRIDVQGGALGGTSDIALVSRPDGQYQCALTSTTTAVQGCVKIATPGRKIPATVDPTVQYPFTTWLDVLTDQKVAVTVAVAKALAGSTGTCFSVEPTTVTLAPPIPSSTLCFAEDGTLTGAKSFFGTLVISGSPVNAPATVALPGPVVARAALPTAAPPTTAPPASVSPGSPRPAPAR